MAELLNASKITAFLTFLLIVTLGFQAMSKTTIKHGSMDLTQIDISNAEPIVLDGEWEFYWKQILFPSDFTSKKHPSAQYIKVPAVWNGLKLGNSELTGEGYATYRLVITKDEKPDLLSLDIPNVYTNYALWVNGVMLASNGVVSKEGSQAKPAWRPHVKIFEAQGKTIEIILQVSNFHHNRGGVHKSIKLGTPDNISRQHEFIVVSNVLLVGGLLILGAFFIGFFLIRKGLWATLYFGLLCLFWGIRALFSNIYLITSFFDSISWELAIRVEYLSLYLSMLVGMLFISQVFLDKKKSIYKYTLIMINYCIIALTVILPPVFFTQLLTTYQFFIAVNFLFVIIVIVRAIFKKQHEAWFSAMGIIIGMTLFAYELTAYAVVVKINFIFLNFGYLAVFFLNSLVLAYHFVGAYKQINVLEEERNRSLEGRLRGI
ncbi:7TM-DISM domain-containing protein [Fulvivirga sp. 29W222]|uniref:7TM-DISM domain-containing protein n=1 Tax=Fulvivirga marina TaxID=2494733 RepID=A0A937KB17_9BACT|nr:7TM-DISM domain-containing protein [Fulvivirga marina]MBL6446296.1 7TM-DISM domain-containing protein [Fulvivirga marina]